VDGVNILQPSSDGSVTKLGEKYFVFKNCVAPTVWANKTLKERQSVCKVQKNFGECINNIEATSPSLNLTTDEAFTKYPAVNTPESTTEPSPVSCIDVLGRCTSFCPTPQRTLVPGSCQYNSAGIDTEGKGTFTYPSKNGPDCNHVTVPPNNFTTTYECPPECHRPEYKAFFNFCDDNLGAQFQVKDTKAADRVPDQPLCVGEPEISGTIIYSTSGDPKNPCELDYDDYWRKKKGYGGDDGNTAYPTNDKEIMEAGISLTSMSPTVTINDTFW
jgi:hypothetical protein